MKRIKGYLSDKAMLIYALSIAIGVIGIALAVLLAGLLTRATMAIFRYLTVLGV